MDSNRWIALHVLFGAMLCMTSLIAYVVLLKAILFSWHCWWAPSSSKHHSLLATWAMKKMGTCSYHFLLPYFVTWRLRDLSPTHGRCSTFAIFNMLSSLRTTLLLFPQTSFGGYVSPITLIACKYEPARSSSCAPTKYCPPSLLSLHVSLFQCRCGTNPVQVDSANNSDRRKRSIQPRKTGEYV